MERIGEVLPGSKSEPSHIHPFDQIYFVRRGTMTLFYGLADLSGSCRYAPVVPKGVVHHDANDGSTPESFIQLNLPQPGPGVPFGVHVVIERSPARARP